MLLDEQVAALEAIGFQVDKTVVDRLVKIFEKPYIYLNELDNEFYGKKSLAKSNFIKHEKLGEFCKNLFNTELKDVLKKAFNVNLKETIIETPRNSMIGVAMTIKGDRGDRERIFSIMSKIASQSVKKSDLKKIYEFTDKLHDVDYLEGRLTNEIKSPLSLVFICNLPMTYLADRVLIVKRPITESASLTPKEITAIFLHELGHFFVAMEYGLSVVYTGFYGNHILKNQIDKTKREIANVSMNKVDDNFEKKKIEEIKQNNKENLVLINKTKKLLSLNKDENKYYLDAMEKTEEFVKTIDNSILKRFNYTIGYRLLLVIVSFISKTVLVLNLSVIVKIIFYNYIILGIFGIDEYYRRSKSDISREVYTASRGKAIFERGADEFVSRMGMGKYAASALIKLQRNMANFNVTSLLPSSYLAINIDPVNKDLIGIVLKAVSYYNFIFSLITNALFGRYEAFNGYENEDVRLRRFAENQLVIFKDANMDIKLKSQMIKEYEDILDIINSKDAIDVAMKPLETINDIVRFLLRSPEKAVIGFTSRDAIKIVDVFDNLLYNKLYYYSAKLDVLINK